jgi:hypothetical protein
VGSGNSACTLRHLSRMGNRAEEKIRGAGTTSSQTQKEHSTMNITNVKVERAPSSSAYALGWVHNNVSYHVWLDGDRKFSVMNGLTNGRPTLYKHSPTGKRVGHLNAEIAKNAEMIRQAIDEAVANHLFTKCDEQILAEEQKKLAAMQAARRLSDVQAAGPQMLAVLKAIDEFWKDGGDRQPLDPGALILDDREQIIVEAVREAVRQAETGGRVDLTGARGIDLIDKE